MSWEDSHPSLKGKYEYAETFPKSFYVVPMKDVSENTLDKQRVREALYDLLKEPGMELNHGGFVEEICQRLGL